MKRLRLRYVEALAAIVLLVTVGCAHRVPSIAHVHIGHALTGWHDTPKKEGLFVVAEAQAAKALEKALSAAHDDLQPHQVRGLIVQVGQLCDGQGADNPDPAIAYGVKQALSEAVSHISFAATSPDATANVQAFSDEFSANALGVLDRCDLITALSRDITNSGAVTEAVLLAPDIATLARANIYGEDLDGDGRIGTSPGEHGLMQLRRDLESMLARENPPYSTVNAWYLFNLIRMPDGSWIFRDLSSAYGGGGGGY